MLIGDRKRPTFWESSKLMAVPRGSHASSTRWPFDAHSDENESEERPQARQHVRRR